HLMQILLGGGQIGNVRSMGNQDQPVFAAKANPFFRMLAVQVFGSQPTGILRKYLEGLGTQFLGALRSLKESLGYADVATDLHRNRLLKEEGACILRRAPKTFIMISFSPALPQQAAFPAAGPFPCPPLPPLAGG